MSNKAKEIITECERNFDRYKNDCSGFVKEVARIFKINLSGDADNIMDQIMRGSWTLLRDGVEAKRRADEGWFVIGGLKSRDLIPPEKMVMW